MSLEANYNPHHDDDKEGDLANSYGLEYQDRIEDEVSQAIADGTLNKLINKLCLNRIVEQQMTLITTLLCILLESARPRLTVQCLCISLGMEALIMNKSGQQIAEENGMTRQNISEIVKSYRKRLGLTNQTRTAKSKAAKASYRLHNRVREKEIK